MLGITSIINQPSGITVDSVIEPLVSNVKFTTPLFDMDSHMIVLTLMLKF